MSVKLKDAVWESGPRGSLPRMILLVLAFNASDDGRCVLSMSDIIESCQCSKRTAIRVLKELVDGGYILCQKRRNNINGYHVLHGLSPADRAAAAELLRRHVEQLDRQESGGIRRVRTWLEQRRGQANTATRKHRAIVLARDGYKCRICGSTANLVLDHVVAIARGGSDDPSNLQTLCWSCNSRKGAR